MPKIRFTIITLFPESLRPYLDTSMMRKATAKGIAQFDFVDLRAFGLGPHHKVDDTPYGGGDGMLMRCEPIFAAIESIKATSPAAQVVVPTPSGTLWTQAVAQSFADLAPTATAEPLHLILFCPHYEGYDARVDSIIDHKICLGPYVLTGGELPALVIIDSIVRLLPGVLGGTNSAIIESFSHGNNLEYPQYTKPDDFRGLKVPDILLSGNHGAIAAWREEHSGQLGD